MYLGRVRVCAGDSDRVVEVYLGRVRVCAGDSEGAPIVTV